MKWIAVVVLAPTLGFHSTSQFGDPMVTLDQHGIVLVVHCVVTDNDLDNGFVLSSSSSSLQASHSPESHQADPSDGAEDWEGDWGKAKDNSDLHRTGERSRPSVTDLKASATCLQVIVNI